MVSVILNKIYNYGFFNIFNSFITHGNVFPWINPPLFDVEFYLKKIT